MVFGVWNESSNISTLFNVFSQKREKESSRIVFENIETSEFDDACVLLKKSNCQQSAIILNWTANLIRS